MNIQDRMRLSSVKRWGVVRGAYTQSVAEHTFNVLLIYWELCKRCQRTALSADMVVRIIEHDMHEVFEGDVPSNRKTQRDLSQMDENELILKACDVAEAYCWIFEYGIGRHAERVYQWVADQFEDILSHLPLEIATHIRQITDDIVCGEFQI